MKDAISAQQQQIQQLQQQISTRDQAIQQSAAAGDFGAASRSRGQQPLPQPDRTPALPIRLELCSMKLPI